MEFLGLLEPDVFRISVLSRCEKSWFAFPFPIRRFLGDEAEDDEGSEPNSEGISSSGTRHTMRESFETSCKSLLDGDSRLSSLMTVSVDL